MKDEDYEEMPPDVQIIIVFMNAKFFHFVSLFMLLTCFTLREKEMQHTGTFRAI